MILSSSEAILFGIQAGIRLHAAARQAYIENTRARAFTMPLPGVSHAPTVGEAANFFRGEGRDDVDANDRLAELDALAQQDPLGFDTSDPVQAAEYLELYKIHRSLRSKERTPEGFSTNHVLVLTTVSQWREGKTPHPTALKRIAGTLIEIGVDYFSSGPGAIVGDTPERRILRDLIEALDDHAFSTDGLEGAIEKVFVATLEGLAENPDLVSGDPQTRTFVASLASGLIGDVNERLASLSPGERLLAADQLGETAELVFKSVIRNSAEIALESPGDFLGVDEPGQAALVTRVGTSVLDAVLPGADSDLDLSGLFTQASLDSVMRSALAVAVEYPELLDLDGDDRTGLRTLFEEVAGAMAERSALLGPDVFPELVRLVFDRTAANLHLFWDADGDEEHLLVTAVGALLDALAEEPDAGTAWGLRFGKDTVVAVAEAVLDEVAQNPGMVTDRISGHPPLVGAITAVVGELATIELDSVSVETVSRLIRVAVQAGAARLDFFDRFNDAGGTRKAAIAHVLEAILSAAFPSDGEHARAAWVLARASVLESITQIAFERLAEAGVDRARVQILQGVLAEVVGAIESKQPFSVERFDALLSEKLASAA